MSAANTASCPCGTDLAPGMLACPVCQRLVHATELAELSRVAAAAERRGDLRGALSKLREALRLLPAATRQHVELARRAELLSDRVDRGEAGPAPSPDEADAPGDAAADRKRMLQAGAAMGGVALLAWKFKFVLVFLATKAKLLLAGLSKSTTLLSMLASLGLYWSIWGWPFALGIVLSIYVHEMGHVAALRHFGIPASAPMFVPGLGAMVRMHAYPQTAREDARVGLAGPIWGLGCAGVSAALYLLTDTPLLAAIASVGAWINLFNLVPIWQLDGARGFRAVSRAGRTLVLAVVIACAVLFEEGLFVLVGLGVAFRLFGDAPAVSDRRALLEFVGLLVLLGALSKLPVPV